MDGQVDRWTNRQIDGYEAIKVDILKTIELVAKRTLSPVDQRIPEAKARPILIHR